MDNNFPNQVPGQMPQQAPGQYPYQPPMPPKGKAGCWGIVGSFIIPILGVILFFVMKNKVDLSLCRHSGRCGKPDLQLPDFAADDECPGCPMTPAEVAIFSTPPSP